MKINRNMRQCQYIVITFDIFSLLLIFAFAYINSISAAVYDQSPKAFKAHIYRLKYMS